LFQVEAFWVVTPCSVVVVYYHFGGPFCFHHQGEVKSAGHNKEVTKYWRKLHNYGVHNLHFSPNNQSDEIKEDQMVWKCSTQAEETKLIHKFNQKILRKDATWQM